MSDYVQVPRELLEKFPTIHTQVFTATIEDKDKAPLFHDWLWFDPNTSSISFGRWQKGGHQFAYIRADLALAAAAPQATDSRDATDWKARCEAAGRVLDLIDNQRYAAQAENEKLRAALDKIATARPLQDTQVHHTVAEIWVSFADQLQAYARAPLSPETP